MLFMQVHAGKRWDVAKMSDGINDGHLYHNTANLMASKQAEPTTHMRDEDRFRAEAIALVATELLTKETWVRDVIDCGSGWAGLVKGTVSANSLIPLVRETERRLRGEALIREMLKDHQEASSKKFFPPAHSFGCPATMTGSTDCYCGQEEWVAKWERDRAAAERYLGGQ